ncbi:hypothetical protein AAHE18_14G030500 [Arachis hypogaea]|nr:uncharacterized protein DS421_14g449630 [Arachis hypogaea]
MIAIPTSRSYSFLVFLVACTFQFFLGFCDDSPNSKDDKTTAANVRGTGSLIAIILIVLVVFSLLSFLLFKLWRKKKREEQYARLLKLFEEDDELELELGLRD